ncbi:MAG TPA: PTS glucose transporter subunit IIA [Nocardioidaceae bacterium]|nr:PTS glucose transporter subunit IIA [Nocardioidaceae bacterium]
MLQVLSPVAGHSVAVHKIPDPVFARGLVGPGIAILPRAGRQSAVAPVSGLLVKLLPHAYLVLSEPGNGVLVHLGIDTVHMQGEGFDLIAREGDQVVAGDEIVTWDPEYVERAGRSTVCAVVVLDCDPATVTRRQVDLDLGLGDLLFEVDC